MENIEIILENKRKGVDCNEEESAEIKGWLRDTIILPQSSDVDILESIQILFPLEYGEFLDEQEDNKALSSPAELKEKWMNKLEESKNQPRKFKPHDTAWDFVEEYYPNYSSSDEICRAQDLYIEIFDNNNASKELDEEYNYLMKSIYEQAIENFIHSQNK